MAAASSSAAGPPPPPPAGGGAAASAVSDPDAPIAGTTELPDGAWSLLLERTRARQVVPFCGAGLSCSILPGWWMLLKKVYDNTAGIRRNHWSVAHHDAPPSAASDVGAAAPSDAGPGTGAGAGAVSAAAVADTFARLTEVHKSDLGKLKKNELVSALPKTAQSEALVMLAVSLASHTNTVRTDDASASKGTQMAELRELLGIDAAMTARLRGIDDDAALSRELGTIATAVIGDDVDRARTVLAVATAPSPESFEDLVSRCGGDLAVVTEVMVQSMPQGTFAASVTALFEEVYKSKAVKVVARLETLSTADTDVRPAARRVRAVRAALGIPNGSTGLQALRDLLASDGEEAALAELRRMAEARLEPQSVMAILASSPPIKGVWPGLDGHKAIVTGPWNCIVTTNWDELFEASFRYLQPDTHEVSSGQHPEEVRRGTPTLPVRYRDDVTQLFAELSTRSHEVKLWKLHGDLSKRGRPEFVSSYADYRKLLLRDVPSLHFLRHLASNYSLLFYGHSLSDKDLLASMDDMIESFGSGGIGPHFWLTADQISESKARYLQRHYAIHIVKVKDNDFGGQLTMLKKLCRLGFELPRTMEFDSVALTARYPLAHTLQLQGAPSTTLNLRREHSSQSAAVALALQQGSTMQQIAEATHVATTSGGAASGSGGSGAPSGGSASSSSSSLAAAAHVLGKFTLRVTTQPVIGANLSAMLTGADDEYSAVAINCGCYKNGAVRGGRMVKTALAIDRVAAERALPMFNRRRRDWRALRVPEVLTDRVAAARAEQYPGAVATTTSMFLVNGQVTSFPERTHYDVRQAVLRRSVYIATTHFLRAAVLDAVGVDVTATPQHPDVPERSLCPDGWMDAVADGSAAAHADDAGRGDRASSSDSAAAAAAAAAKAAARATSGRIKHVRLLMPEIGSGRGLLRAHDAFLAQLSAIGDFTAALQAADGVQRRLPRLEVVISAWDAGLRADIGANRVDVGQSWGRAVGGWARFTVLFKHRQDGWTSRRVRLPLHATVGDMAHPLGVAIGTADSTAHFYLRGASIQADTPLLCAGVTEGCLVRLEPVRDMRRIAADADADAAGAGTAPASAPAAGSGGGGGGGGGGAAAAAGPSDSGAASGAGAGTGAGATVAAKVRAKQRHGTEAARDDASFYELSVSERVTFEDYWGQAEEYYYAI